MLGLITILALAGPTGDPEPPYSRWVNDYHHLAIDCDFITHSFGRNAAWGLWRMPFEQVAWEVSHADWDGGLILTFSCLDGTACIQQGRLEDTPERISRHEVPIKSADRIEGLDAIAAAVSAGCAVAEAELS
ncbi:hypothetical protein [Brevundimonas sp.]|uniref:hypothetical protein n=1 Tax=Brevundimonas sp. TaxID=1871086 RepID=UPI001DC0619E|nr:hypothetical protein [Brevundimonas sp.]MBL0947121.1 hypothetical protein [Brevundimonas sp.]